MAEFRFISLNVRGLRDNKKRAAIFTWLLKQKEECIFLQECHCATSADADQWGKEWDGKTYWALGTTDSRGVAILFKRNAVASLNVLDINCDVSGRYLVIRLCKQECNLTICNVYAPNKIAERDVFFTTLNGILNRVDQNDIKIVGGDFNCVLCPEIDRKKLQRTG